MSETSDLEGPRWRSGPFVYGSVLLCLPLLLLVVWALPTLLPAILKGNVSSEKAAVGIVWGVILLGCPIGALTYRRRYLYSEEWQRPRRISILWAWAGYAVALLSYAAVGYFVLNGRL